MQKVKPGHHPITDMLAHGRHPFPKDIEDLLRRLSNKPGAITTEIAMDAYDWERAQNLDSGRSKLLTLCRHHLV